MINEIVYEWTISIVAQVDKVHQWEYSNLRKTIESQDKISNVRYFILEYRQGNGRQAIDGEYSILEINKSQPFFKILTKPTPGKLTDPKIITDFLNNYALDIQKGKSKHHTFISWGHGAGFGYFTSRAHNTKPEIFSDKGTNRRNVAMSYLKANVITVPTALDLAINETNLVLDLAKNETSLRNFESESDKKVPNKKRKIIQDPDNQIGAKTELITANQLSEIFRDTYLNAGEKLNVFIANSCYTNMFEVGYVLKDTVELYAASQSIVPFAGVDYNKLFESLEDFPEQNQQHLAYNITDSFLPRYTLGRFAEAFKAKRPALNVRDFSISVNSLDQYENLFEIINEVAELLIEDIKAGGDRKKDCLKRIDIAREYCGDFAQGIGFIDFTNFFTELIKSYVDENPGQLKQLYKKWFYLKEKTLLSIINPGSLFRVIPDDFYSHSPQMFSIFFPSKFRRSHVISDFINFYSKFLKLSGGTWFWSKFLDFYWYAENTLLLKKLYSSDADEIKD